ncbi:class I SAM-dependent DNA methyltransferase [Microbacterium sp. RU33B]|uniref:HsdM family class I SAM-dependent methyltransferase n=1 Tax=Microbacterium sp. RU33B TaxID=1907390 RepID=UPI000966B1AD|nr:N-6 DNA methylase [Microbacterium sp. RU33B]SIT72097.1 Type I restriction-modification system, DNA methylase subunit [Microbacterium sp. RU33B]
MSEDLVARQSRPFGRLAYLSLGSTTLAQLKRSRFIRSTLAPDEEQRKPDAIVFLPLGGIKAVVEIKQPKDLTARTLPAIVKKYAPIARAVCKLLIITDGKTSYWYNAISEKPVVDEAGSELRLLFDPALVDSERLSPEAQLRLIDVIEACDQSLTKTSNQLAPRREIDPSPLAKSVWQKIWVNTGKDPGKCLYNVVEILVFKFLSDAGVLTPNYSFRRIVELLAREGADDALTHYASISRKQIRKLFPASREDGTTIINGTIFVNEKGDANLAQAALFGEVIRAFQSFDDENGSLRNIDRNFKTRLYETFLRQQAGIRSLGQYFTPRNVVQSIVRMSKAGSLKDGASICDPFCGVGGFLLEAINDNANLWDQFQPVDGKVSPKIVIRGYDKGSDEKDDERTIILAKANMLVYLSNLLSEFHSEELLKEFADNAFNDVFRLIRSNLGTFERIDPTEQYDLILTNPPYVTSGSLSLRNNIDALGLEKHYAAGGRGTESLALQWIINHLKPGGEAYVVVPDGLLNQHSMLSYIKAECLVRAVVALPSRTFYSTPKKTYILAIEKKGSVKVDQTEPVYTFMVSEIGESRDTRRVPIEHNDLVEMQEQFSYFSTNRAKFIATNPRNKMIAWSEFDALSNWLVERRWSEAEKVDLGVIEESIEVDPESFRSLVDEAQQSLALLLKEL